MKDGHLRDLLNLTFPPPPPPPPPPPTHTLINRQNINLFKQQANTMTAMSQSHLIYNWVCHFLFSLFLSASFDEYIVMDRGLIE